MIWLPCFHDMGMTGYLTVHVGAELVKITPMDFLRDTLWWAKLIDKYKGTTTAAPNFAYNLFANRLRKQATAGEFDLSSLRWALSGAEQVDPLDVEGLCDAGAPFGLKPEAIIPAYGMAETTVAVSFSECGGGMVTDEVDWPKLWCRVVDHDLTPGGRTTYFMTGPDGDKHAGYWQITAVDEPTSISFVDGFADLDFNPDPALPVSRNVYTFAEHGGGARAIYVSTFESAEALQQVLDMGVVEGATSAINQIDDLVAS